jgi:hypothetical protein
MPPTDERGRRLAGAINRAALLVSLALLAAMAALWWSARPREREAPRWPAPGIVPLVGASAATGERWIVALNPECPTCRARLAALDSAFAARPGAPALGVLLVDVPDRPAAIEGAGRLSAGVWWDSASVWRRRWGRNAYGEVLDFAAGGSLARLLPPDSSRVPEAR